MIQFKINPTQNPQNPSHRPKHCLRKIEDLIFIILLWPLINDQHDDILNRNSCQSLKTKFCSVFFQNISTLDFGADFGSTIGHSKYLFAIQFLEIGNQLFQKYYFTNICATYQITILLRCCRPMQFIQIYCLVIPRNQFTIPPNNPIAVLRWFAIWALASMDKSNFSKNLCTKKYLHQKISAPKISTPKNLFTKNNLRTKKI